jgi:hypothetical protein
MGAPVSGSAPLDPQSALIAEQLRHAIDLLRADIDQLAAAQKHADELASQRLSVLEEMARDHETRIRLLTDGVTQFKVWSGLASGSSSLVALLALLRTFVGG